MNYATGFFRTTIFVASLVCCATCAWAQAKREVARRVPVQPQRLESATPPAPTRIRTEDRQLLRDLIRRQGKGSAPPAPRIHTTTTTSSGGRKDHAAGKGVSRIIRLDTPEVVNRSSTFRFRDVTQRSQPPTRQLSLPQRRAAVEAYRRSLARPNKGRGVP